MVPKAPGAEGASLVHQSQALLTSRVGCAPVAVGDPLGLMLPPAVPPAPSVGRSRAGKQEWRKKGTWPKMATVPDSELKREGGRRTENDETMRTMRQYGDVDDENDETI